MSVKKLFFLKLQIFRPPANIRAAAVFSPPANIKAAANIRPPANIKAAANIRPQRKSFFLEKRILSVTKRSESVENQTFK